MGARKQLFKVPAGNRLQTTESPKNAKRKMSLTSTGKSFLPTKNNVNGAVKVGLDVIVCKYFVDFMFILEPFGKEKVFCNGNHS